MKKFTIQDCNNFALVKDGKCLSKVYINTHYKLEWICKNGHKWEASFNNIKNGHWCPYCAGNKSKTIDDCNKLASSNNGKCLSKEYINIDAPYLWECDKGHRWENTLWRVQSGIWCNICSGINNYTIKDCHKAAHKQNGKCLSNNYINNNTKMLWKCAQNHIWETTFEKIKMGRWCHHCSPSKPLNLNACKKVAKLNRGLCLSKKYVNISTKYIWQCKNNHKWLASLNSVKNQNTWCPICNNSKKQLFLFEILKKNYSNFDIYYNFRDFDWLKTSKYGKMEIDIYVKNLKLAIEYDGKQHFEPVCFGNISLEQAKKNLIKQKQKDLLKNNKINKSDDIDYFIRFNYKEKLTEKYILNRIEEVLK